ncbi:MAG: TorF family putative porin [Azoarcus sp.]|jgi:uncharacterized protein (TIGR02001 family)|nr:TorF family putative porin [Azoarcus sp.]
MQKRILATALAAALALPVVAQADDAALPISANLTLASEYAFRGVTQTDERPALQGGFDYKHSSGLYVGTWGSNISWIDNGKSSLEIDFYGGYAPTFGDFGLDVGVLRYQYPGSKHPKAHTTEGYVGVSWKFLSFKYSHAFTKLFGIEKSKGSDYLDLSADYEIIKGLTLNAHFGKQYVDGPTDNYKDWKLGATYSYGGFDFGLHYVDTDIDKHNNFADEDDADARVIFSITKSF